MTGDSITRKKPIPEEWGNNFYKSGWKPGIEVNDLTGIGEITHKNYPEVYARHKFLNKLASSVPMMITLEDVRNHIGLKTNVALEKLPKWRNRIASSEWSSIRYNVDEKVNEINKLGGTK